MIIDDFFNQTCNVYDYVIDSYGNKVYTLIGQDIACRFSDGSSTKRMSQGEDVAYDGNLHTPVDPQINKGFKVEVDSINYTVELTSLTRDVDGTPLFRFSKVNQIK